VQPSELEAGSPGLSRVEAVGALLGALLEGGGLVDEVGLVLQARDWIEDALDPESEASMERGLELEDQLRAAVRGEVQRVDYDPEIVELFGEFYEESVEGLSEVDELLTQAEQGRLQSDGVDAIFRTFHTIKGVAGFVQQPEIVKLAHAAENVLVCVRSGDFELAGPALNLIFEVTGVVRDVLDEARRAMAEHRGARVDARVGPLRSRLITAASGGPFELGPHEVAQVAPPAPDVVEAVGPVEVRGSVKLDLQRVDKLIGLITELVGVEAELRRRTTPEPVLRRLRELVGQLGDERAGLRRAPMKPLFQRAARLVRDLSRKTGKPVELAIEGSELEVDRSLMEHLGAALLHLVRNAVDHGLETSEARLAQGKPETGLLNLRAWRQGGELVVELEDDGRGLDRERILKRARQGGLVAQGAALDDGQVFQLIFAPGFSTAVDVTNISGRGVGMDVVRQAVESARGEIRIASEPGCGSRFRLVLPERDEVDAERWRSHLAAG
jgi:two-component system chemotaxis sensor kinase CheA